MTNQSVCRILLLLSAILIPAFGVVYGISEPRAVDPTWIRLVLSAVALALFGISFHRRVARHTHHFVVVVFALIMCWFWYLCLANGFSENYALGMLYVHTAIALGLSLFLDRLRVLVLFAVAMLLLLTAEALFVPGVLRERAVLILCAATITALCYIATHLRLMAERSVYSSEARYRSLFTGASDAIILMTPDTGHVIEANDRAAALLGRSRPAIEGSSLDGLAGTRQWRSTVNEALGTADEAGNIELNITTGAGDVHLLANASRISVGGVSAVLVVLRDISERKAYEAKLIEARQRAEEVLQLKSSLLNNMSHELRTPLTGIIGFAEVLREKANDEDREFLSIIRSSGQRLLETVNSILNLARLDSENIDLRDGVVAVNEVASGVATSYERSVAAKGLTFDVRIAGDAYATGDAAAVERILENLLSNSLKFTASGRISLSVEARESAVEIAVSDTGIGIGPDFVPFVFDEFRQESSGLSRDYEGSGLGLAIVRRLVELMDGTISCRSRKGDGTTMTVILPAANVATVGDAAVEEGSFEPVKG
jgi:two-component system, NarL family, sensor histidine kinase BarA